MTARPYPPPPDPPSTRWVDAARLVRGVSQLVCLYVAEGKTVARWTR